MSHNITRTELRNYRSFYQRTQSLAGMEGDLLEDELSILHFVVPFLHKERLEIFISLEAKTGNIRWYNTFFEREIAGVEESWHLPLVQIPEFEEYWRKQLDIEALEFSNELHWALVDNGSEKNLQNIIISELYRSERREVPKIAKFCDAEGVCSGCSNCITRADGSSTSRELMVDLDESACTSDDDDDLDRSVQLLMDAKARCSHAIREQLVETNQAIHAAAKACYSSITLKQICTGAIDRGGTEAEKTFLLNYIDFEYQRVLEARQYMEIPDVLLRGWMYIYNRVGCPFTSVYHPNT